MGEGEREEGREGREKGERRRKRKIRRKEDFQISEVRKVTAREIENRLEAAVRESLTL